MTAGAHGDRFAGLRPSYDDRARCADALAAAVSEGRLTEELYEERLAAAERAVSIAELDALVADLPSSEGAAGKARPRRRGLRALAAVAVMLFAGAASFGITEMVAGRDSGEASAGQGAGAGSEEGAGGEAGDEGGGIASERLDLQLDTVPDMDPRSVPAAIGAARDSGIADIDRVTLTEGFTYVDGRDAGGEYRSMSIQPDRMPTVDGGSEWRGVFLDLDALDFDLDEAVSRAREYDPSAGEEVRSVMVYRGTGGPADSGESGNLVDVAFEESDEPFAVTMRMHDLARVE
ncbi:DUF1707 SHOCT-like domain-containing protein [Brevibacterium album]|uniref:DUF1707 SHOCT-like domain-containing protein n=1 Tax=Brevibacterium album TaxID=417948 RepID=UPI0004291746|nr:DUF1707 domain-containing protein [Brevibacterium album]